MKMAKTLFVLFVEINQVANIMANSLAKAAKASLNVLSEETWPTNVVEAEIVPLISIIETNVSTADLKNASKWEWEKKVKKK